MTSKKTMKVGRKRKPENEPAAVAKKIRQLPGQGRGLSLRKLADALGVNKSSLYRVLPQARAILTLRDEELIALRRDLGEDIPEGFSAAKTKGRHPKPENTPAVVAKKIKELPVGAHHWSVRKLADALDTKKTTLRRVLPRARAILDLQASGAGLRLDPLNVQEAESGKRQLQPPGNEHRQVQDAALANAEG